MLENPEPIDFRPLIAALEKAQTAITFNAQLAELELALVESELNPKANNFCELLWAIEAVSSVDIQIRNWQGVEDQLESFF